MSKLAFFCEAEVVYSISLSALRKRDYKILLADEEKGMIKASRKKGLLKPEVVVEIKIDKLDESQSNLDIHSSIKKNWLSKAEEGTKEEEKLINTLYKIFERK